MKQQIFIASITLMLLYSCLSMYAEEALHKLELCS